MTDKQIKAATHLLLMQHLGNPVEKREALFQWGWTYAPGSQKWSDDHKDWCDEDTAFHEAINRILTNRVRPEDYPPG